MRNTSDTTDAPAAAALEREQEKKRVALTSLLAALLLVTLKTVVGLATQSLGVLSEAAHSGLDMVAAAVTYFSVRVADRPADEEHHYGHGKVENFAAFVETGLLLVTCGWIVWEAVMRLFFRDVHVEPSLWAFGVMGVSIVVDHFRSKELDQVARKYNSQALEADALHFRTDVWSSAVVILGLLGVAAADRFGWPGLHVADPVAALVVAGIVVWISLKLGKRTVDALLDTAPEGLRSEVEQAVAGVEGVIGVEHVRARSSGARTFVDLTIGVTRTLPFDRVHRISEEVEAAVSERVGSADVVVHMEPRPGTDETLFDRVRAIAQRHNLAVHEVSAHDIREPDAVKSEGDLPRSPSDSAETKRGWLVLDLDVEVDEHLTLYEAHGLADRVEQDIYRELAEVDQINTHIETLDQRIVEGAELEGLARALRNHLANRGNRFPDLIDCHDVQVRLAEDKVVASMHATFDGNLSIKRVHDVTQNLEAHLHRRFPQVFRFTVHTEPPEER